MNLIEASLFILLLATLAGPLAKRLHLPAEVFLVVGSAVLSLIPGMPRSSIDPTIVFGVFLPPILFAAAYFTSWRDFKFNRRPIALLAIGLVLVTAATIGSLVHMLVPGVTWVEGLLLGAIVSPPDAAAATAIVRRLKAPRRLITVVEGESLVNDAMALVLYRFTLLAVISGSFSLPQAVANFFFVAAGGVVIGLLVGFVSFRLLTRLGDSQAQTTLSLLTAFASYLLAERAGASGVIATVMSGLYFGRMFPEHGDSRARLVSRATWDTVVFIINGFVFVLMGLQLPLVLRTLKEGRLASLILLGLLVSAAVIVVRVVWVFPVTYLPRWLMPSLARRDPAPPWQLAAALGWTGMRGIVSLAAVLALPERLPSGEPFPHRDLFIFLTYCVIVTTLLVPALTLPMLFKLFNIHEGDAAAREESQARIHATEAALQKVKSWEASGKYPAEPLRAFQERLARRLAVIRPQLEPDSYSNLDSSDLMFRRMNAESIMAEREALIQLRRDDKLHDEVFHRLSDELDLEELRARTPRV